MADGCVYIILVNWNSWRNTVACLESIFRLRDVTFRVIVCDNGSADDSLSRLRDWAEGRNDIAAPADDPLAPLYSPPIAKPIRYAAYRSTSSAPVERGAELPALVFVDTGENLGFAGGVNVGLRLARSRPDFQYAWLLNNDTVVRPDTLKALVAHAEQDPRAGLCGSTLLFYDEPERVQAIGGALYSRWFGTHKMNGAGLSIRQVEDGSGQFGPIDYVSGASMLVSKRFIDDIGLMNESYFLYMEENDWAARGRGRYRLDYSPRSFVYHRDGASTGAGGPRKRKSFKGDFYSFRSRLLFTARHAPWALPVVATRVFAAVAERLIRGRWKLADIPPTLADHRRFKRRRRATVHGSAP